MSKNTLNVKSKRNWNVGKRNDPLLTYNFVMEIDGIIVGGFNNVSGLTVETLVDKKSFGGENHRDHVFFMQTKYTDITLKHGMTGDYYMWDWYEKVINGKIERHNGSIYLLDDTGNPKIWWNILEACPIKWEGPAFNATTNEVAAETIILTHNGISMHR